MLLVALTGNYGMGKSTVLSLFRKFGVSTLDADKIVDSLFRKKEILEKIRQLMGNAVFHDNGSLNKKKLQRSSLEMLRRDDLSRTSFILLYSKK